ncbi:FtsX-like permease family protein [Kineosporia mesophila]|uniref:FtsX-like permease family protein n=1 Tax=Kineosporia mesophila TaxID=566012 RepID=A0ABP6Z147_9ACTN|nr:FtsX-like permease family protein [Kineosporia mesophila]
MNLTVLGTQLEGVRRRPGRGLMTGLSVLLATFVVFSTVLAYRVTTQTFLDSFSPTSSGTSLVAENETGFSVRDLRKVRATDDVVAASAQLSASFDVAGAAGRSLEVDADPGSGPLALYRLTQGAYPQGPRQIALSEATARAWSIAPGAHLRLIRLGGETGTEKSVVRVTVTGLVDSAVTGLAYAPDLVVAELSGQAFTRIDIAAAAGSPPSLSAVLGPARIRTGDEVRKAEAQDAVRQFDVVFAVISAFVLIAVIAAMLVATSTFRIVFAQRLKQLALLRTIGGQQGQIGLALTVEGALTGLVAGVLGVAAAVGGVRIAVAVAGASGRALAPSGFPLTAAVVTVVGAGLLTVAAVVAPALSASDVSPLQALRSADTTPARPGIGTVRLVLGLVFAAGAAGLICLVVSALPVAGQEYTALDDNLLQIVASGTLAFLAMIALGPLLVRALLGALAPALRLLGTTGELAIEGLRSASRRAAVVTMVVALGVTLVTGTVVAAASARAVVNSGLAMGSPADFVVDGRVPAATLRQLAAEPAVSLVSRYRMFPVDDYTATDLDLATLPSMRAVTPAHGTLERDLGGRAVISDRVSYELGVSVGDRIRLGKGTSLIVQAVLSGNGPLEADLVVSASELTALGAPDAPSGVLLDAPDTAEPRIRAVLGPGLSTGLSSLGTVGDPIRSAMAKLFAAALGLVGLTVLIALVGVGTTMSLTVMERTREFGMLRALGLTRPGLRALIGTESCLYGVLGTVLGLALGIPYAWLSVLALNLNAPLELPVAQLLAVALLLALVTPLAGLLPTRRAARVSPVAALGTGG